MVVSHSCCHSSQSRKRLLHRTTVGKTASALFLNTRILTIFKMYPVALFLGDAITIIEDRK